MRILHFADVHLDRPFVGLSRDAAERRREDLREAFRRCLGAAQEHDADLVTIGGDLWEDENVTADTRASVVHELEKVSIPVLIVAGNHDPLLTGGNYARTHWPANVKVFDSDEPSEYRAGGVSVWGVSWTGGQLHAGFLDRFRAPTDGRAHFLLVHGTAQPVAHLKDDAYCPFAPDRVVEVGFALCLAGHIHAASSQHGFVYPGSPEPLAISELGRHCFALVDVDATGAVSVDLLDVNRRRFERRTVDCTDATSSAAIAERLAAALDDPDPENVFLQVDLTGEVAPEARVDPGALIAAHRAGYADLDVRDRTVPAYDLDALATQQTARGRFVRRLRERLDTTTDEDERATLELAMRAGLRALDRRDDVI